MDAKVFMRTTKTLNRLRGCAGWFEFLLVDISESTFYSIHAVVHLVRILLSTFKTVMVLASTVVHKQFVSSHEKTYLQPCEPTEDSNQHAHPHSLIRNFVVRMVKHCTLGYPKCAQRRFWSVCANAQADLNLRWAQISEGTFSDVAALSKLPGAVSQFVLMHYLCKKLFYASAQKKVQRRIW